MRVETIKYSNVQTRLRLKDNISLQLPELVDLCKALDRMAPQYVSARRQTIEILTRPDKIITAIQSTIRDYPDDEQAHIAIPNQKGK